MNAITDCQLVRRWLASNLAFLLVLTPAAIAQTPAPQTAPQPATIRSLKVVALAGNLEMNDLQNRVMAPLVVQVLDQNDHPVEGADVTFRFPIDGPSAMFVDQNAAATFRTNVDGQAAAIGWMANGQVGTFKIQVTAFRGSEAGATIISMTNATRITESARMQKKNWWSTKWGRIAIVGGAAAIAVAVVLATRGSGNNTKVIIGAPGSPTIGAPE